MMEAIGVYIIVGILICASQSKKILVVTEGNKFFFTAAVLVSWIIFVWPMFLVHTYKAYKGVGNDR